MEKRPAKKDDQENTERAYEILTETVNLNSDIERTLWVGAMISLLIEGFINSGISYEAFCAEWDRIKTHYKPWWEIEN